MKKLFLLGLIISLFSITSCNDDSNDTDNPKKPTTTETDTEINTKSDCVCTISHREMSNDVDILDFEGKCSEIFISDLPSIWSENWDEEFILSCKEK